MAVPRPLLLALIGVVLLAATFMATRNSQEASQSSSDPAPAAAAPNKADATAAKPEPAKADPKPAAKPEAKVAAKPDAKAAAKPRSESARPARREASRTQVARVERALDRGRVVVLAFFQPGADDRATQAAVASLSRRQAAVFSERLSRIGRYRDLIGSLGVSQAPAVVIIDSKRRARVVEGYVDAETLAQEVVDARG